MPMYLCVDAPLVFKIVTPDVYQPFYESEDMQEESTRTQLEVIHSAQPYP